MEIWCSKKGDTELLLSQATPNNNNDNNSNDNDNDDDNELFSLMKMEKYVNGSENVSKLEVGFIAEVVTNMGQGFYIIRDDQGHLMQ